MHDSLIIYTDGGSRGNPGPSAIGVYVKTMDKRYREFLGTGTNNFAEYQAIIFALKKAKALLGNASAEHAHIEIRSDSQLVVNQLSGTFKIKEKDLFELFIAVWNLKQEFAGVTFTYVPREQNRIADALVNEALDEREQTGLFS